MGKKFLNGAPSAAEDEVLAKQTPADFVAAVKEHLARTLDWTKRTRQSAFWLTSRWQAVLAMATAAAPTTTTGGFVAG